MHCSWGFHLKVDRNQETWNGLGNHEVGKYNSNGLLLQLYEEMTLRITNNMFQQKNKYETPWMQVISNSIYLLIYLKEGLTSKTFLRCECSMDRQLFDMYLTKVNCEGKVRLTRVSLLNRI